MFCTNTNYQPYRYLFGFIIKVCQKYANMKKQVTVKIILDTRYEKKNAETFPAKLRVTFEKKQVYYKTKYSFTEAVWKKMNGGRPDQLKDTLIELQDIEKGAKKIIEKMPVFSFETFKKKYFNYSDTNTISGSFKQYITELRTSGQIGNAINNECASKSLEKFSPGALLSEVTIDFLNRYESWMKERSRSTTTMSMYLRALRLNSGRVLVGDFSRAAIAQSEGLRLRTSDSHASIFTANQVAFLLEKTENLVVYRPDAFVTAVI